MLTWAQFVLLVESVTGWLGIVIGGLGLVISVMNSIALWHDRRDRLRQERAARESGEAGMPDRWR